MTGGSGTTGGSAESHLMRRTPRQGWGAGGVVVYTLEDLAAPVGEDPKAVIEVSCSAGVARLIGGGVPPVHRGLGHGRRLGAQVIAALRAEGCRTVVSDAPAAGPGRRMLLDLGFVPVSPSTWQLTL